MDRRLLVIILIGAALMCFLGALLKATGVLSPEYISAWILGGFVAVTGALFVERA